MGIKIANTKKQKQNQSSFDISSVLTKEITLFGNAFNSKKKEQWYAELSVLQKSGIDLKSGLELLSETQKKEKDRVLMSTMTQQLIDGSSFSDILKNNSSFSDYEYYAIKIGEQTGQLAQISLELSEFYKRKNDLRREIVAALTYPIIVLCTALLVIFFMLRYVVPMFVDIFKQNNVDLPNITKAIINFSNFMGEYGILLLGIFTIGIVLLAFISKKTWYRKFIGKMQLKIPILGNYFRKIYMAQFTQALSLLTSAKVPMVDSIDLVKNMINFYPLQEGLQNTNDAVIAGGKLSTSFAQNPVFDKKMIAMIRVAEETNQTEFIFQKLNEQYNQQVKHQSQVISNVLNPLLTIIVGIIVGVILIAMYLPMFRLSSVIG
ncbi:type II secretion system F family protein [Aquimarina sp. AD10]|uniref:type II secretion system F family protein n=1 Tax=Aquimarina TaxID=290174 RepID=UPI000E51B775|nr:MULTISPECIES: type II secretion system F family protein [Aquimarina]AXT61376.1 type II secretion system F family protein [Aquimarina sp. AD10]RKN01430.1 type II secretion system F family protein [Aquimarina sp. AD10]